MLRDEARRSQDALEARLTDLSAERDSRAAEALAAQNRFAAALDQVSRMQSQLLESEAGRRELETGIGVVQASLQQAVQAEKAARADGAAANSAATINGLTVTGTSKPVVRKCRSGQRYRAATTG